MEYTTALRHSSCKKRSGPRRKYAGPTGPFCNAAMKSFGRIEKSLTARNRMRKSKVRDWGLGVGEEPSEHLEFAIRNFDMLPLTPNPGLRTWFAPSPYLLLTPLRSIDSINRPVTGSGTGHSGHLTYIATRHSGRIQGRLGALWRKGQNNALM